MTPTNPLITEFMKKHQLTRSDQPKANDPTFVAFGSKQLDYFLHTKNCHIVQLEVVKHNLSDHYGVVVDLEINPTK